MAQCVDALVELLPGLSAFACKQRLLPTGALQSAGAHAQEPHRSALADILSQKIADAFEVFSAKTGGRGEWARAGEGLKVRVTDLHLEAAGIKLLSARRPA